MKSFFKTALIMVLLVVVAGVLRLPKLNVLPPELFGDEIDVGYQAYSLLKTGQDIYRHPMPFYMQSLSEWRLPLIVYQTVPSIKIFGLNEWGVRLPEAIFGIMTPVIAYLLVYQLTKENKLALLAGLSIVIMPWHIMYSRMAAFGVVTLLDLTMIGVILFLKRKHVLGSIFFVLTLFTYSTAIIFTPLIIVALIVLQRRKPSLVSGVIFVIAFLGFVGLSYFGHGGDRFNSLTIFNSKDVVDKVVSLRNDLPGPGENIFHNKIESWGRLFIDNYVRAFSTDFLFVRGDPVGRHSIQVMGQLLPVTAPFIILGLYYLARRRHFIFLVWLILAPIPAALTTDGAFHATRLFLMVLPLGVAFAAGIYWCMERFRILTIIYTLLVVLNLVWFVHFYAVHYPRLYSRWWQVGFKSSFTELAKLSPLFDHVYINNTYEPSLMRFLFYQKYSPADFHRYFTLDQHISNIVPGFNGYTLDGKYFFGTFADDSHLMHSHSLYLLSQRDDGPPRSGEKLLFTAYDPANKPIFYWVTKDNP